MSNRIKPIRVVLALLGTICANHPSVAEQAKLLHYKQPMTVAARRCLGEILKTGDWRYTPQFHKDMMSVAAFAQIKLDGPAREHYVYVMHEFSFCGTAGCSMLIGEVGQDGICHEIYSGSGFVEATEVLQKRDHGYRRLYTPCELRFNGQEYEQIHEECPRIDVQR